MSTLPEGLTIPERILIARTRAGLNITQLADRVGVSRQTIHAWETGDTVPNKWTVQALAAAVKVPAEELIDPTNA